MKWVLKAVAVTVAFVAWYALAQHVITPKPAKKQKKGKDPSAEKK